MAVRPELAYARAMRAEFPAVVGELRELLGARLVAYLGAVKETRAVHQWADGTRQPGEETRRRLRLALQLALMVSAVDGPEVARAWFQGLDPAHGDRSPARLARGRARGGRPGASGRRARLSRPGVKPGRRWRPGFPPATLTILT